MRLLLYNVMLHPELYIRNGQTERSEALLQRLAQEAPHLDGMAFCEWFHGPSLKRLRATFPNHTVLTGPQATWSSLQPVSSGLVFVTNRPVHRTGTYVFRARQDSDQYAAKGVLWVELELVGGALVHLLITHLQAWDSAEEVRRQQLQELHVWWNSLGVPTTAPVLLLGDLNYDFHDVNNWIASEFGVTQSMQLTSERRFATTSENALRGLDGTANVGSCEVSYVQNLLNPPHAPRVCLCCKDILVDWALSWPGQPQWARLDGHVEVWRAPQPLSWTLWKFGWFSSSLVQTTELSDHFPVVLDAEPYAR